MKLKVGSQAFVLDVQNQLVKQGIVIAENKQKTIDKVHVTYDIQFDDNKIESFIDDLINVQIFDSIKRLRQIMIINATQAIDDLISHIKVNKQLVETSELEARNPYAISKLATDQLICQISKKKKIRCVLLIFYW
jgi:hypothetical protein